MDYKEAGVDRAAGEDFVQNLKKEVASKKRAEILSGLGGYGAAFVAPPSIKSPVFMATTDGVGTKLLLAEEVGPESFVGIGQDCVAMCTNDLAASLAEPLLFLDYLATGKIEKSALKILMRGIIEACEASGCSLAGGETAEMPGYYPPGRFDVAGFAVGVLERSDYENPSPLQEGDLVFGLASDGFHSNGYSLVRKIMEKQGWSLSSKVAGQLLREALLRPTRIYVKETLQAFRNGGLKRAAHITGGGLIENLPRVLSPEVGIELFSSALAPDPLQAAFVEAGGLERREAYSTFNMGIGFCWIVSADKQKFIEKAFPEARRIGRVITKGSDSEPVTFDS